jgi:hypothetical protein
MDSQPSPLWLHSHSGHTYRGLMIVGDRAALAELGRQLQDAQPLGKAVAPGWPVTIARPKVVGPDTGSSLDLSFHLKGDLPLETLLPLRNRAWRSTFFLIGAICAVTGAVTIWNSLVRFILHGL